MKRRNALYGILTVLTLALCPGCGLMQAKTDIVLEPQGASAFERALDYEEQQEFDLAAAEYQAALVKDPADSRAWVNLGLLHERAGRTRNAVACWQRAVTVNPKDARAYNLLGNVWMQNGDYSKAVAYYRRAADADGQFAEPHWNMAAALRHMNREDEAADEYRAFIQLAGDTQRDDIGKATLFVAELGGTGVAPAHRFVTETPAVAQGEAAEQDEPPMVLVLEQDDADLPIGGTVQGGETEATPDAGETPAVDETVDGEAPADELNEMIEPEMPAEAAPTPAEAAPAPAENPKTPVKADVGVSQTERIAEELDRLEREAKARVQAEQ